MANDGDKIEIEITLADGTIQKARIDLEKALKDAGKKGGDEVEEGLTRGSKKGLGKVGDFIEETLGFRIPKVLLKSTAAIATIGFAVKKAFDFTLAGEQIKQINGQFDLLANRAGVSGEALKAALESAAGGLVDDDSILRSTNKALIELGESADKLPQIMALARQATLVNGKEILENFEDINQAIASGQTKSLKGMQLYVDQERAIKAYASSLGVASNALSQSGRQQAILNAVLDKGAEAYKGIKDLTPVTNEAKRFGVALGEVGDTVKVTASNVFGPAFAAISRAAAGATDSFNRFLKAATRTETAEEKLKRLEGVIQTYSEKLKSPSLMDIGPGIERFKVGLKSAQDEVALLKMQMDDARKAGLRFGGGGGAEGASAGHIDPKVAAANETAFQSSLLQAQQQAQQLEQARIEAMAPSSEKIAELARMREEKLDLVTQEYALKRLAVDQSEVMSVTQKEQMKTAIYQQEAQARASILEAEAANSLTVGDGFSAMFGGLDSAIQEFAKNGTKNFAELGKAMFSTLTQGAGQAFASMGKAIAKGENGLKAFAGAMLSVLGGAAVQTGTMFMAQGMAYMLAGMPNGPGLIAAGAALATIGGVLQGSGGASDSGGGVSAGASGGLNAPAGDAQLKQEPAKPAVNVELNVHGNILDRRQTGLELLETINEAVGMNDARIIGGLV